ncbi:MAG: pyrroline-5-carboxylate reductase [Pirellulaceae bacterium]|nr:pyrroline-5-carboxylate reductase [Pirellulaceae bacterium]
MNKMQLAVVGGGQMGRALVGGMLASNVLTPQNAHIVEPNGESQAWWKEHYPNVAIGDDLSAAVKKSDTVLFAVKPNVLPHVATQPTPFWSGKLVVSIAAGVSIAKLCSWVGHQRVVRVMPNTPSLVGAGASAFCIGSDVTKGDVDAITSMLSSVGMAVEVNESQMDAVTGLSGSGPAYVCLIIEALADGGVLTGLPRPLAMKLATQTVLGAAKMVAETGRHPGELKDAVASPGGTTIAALKVLEQNGVRGALIEAVKASANRSRELGQE